MPTIKTSFRKTKAGVLCTARVTLACGCKVRDDAQGRDAASAQSVVLRLIKSRIAAHECDG